MLEPYRLLGTLLRVFSSECLSDPNVSQALLGSRLNSLSLWTESTFAARSGSVSRQPSSRKGVPHPPSTTSCVKDFDSCFDDL
ncbi:hypothetical protein Pcinc_025148 [Petrolisthes cinctipes]|uniref:Uncharacterized protein n=1 Tax=Petrolisthes cinctipes TaxID=88211 RepID=A0AAE1F8F8_PETCI|nr:hypothetical protein Pcinc_025148 [Petrolisthes cinctipes]